MDPRLQHLAETIQRQTLADLQRRHGTTCDWTIDAAVTIKPGAKYVKVDVGRSGKYMVDAAGNIWGIKGYGVIHRGHQYGTLDTVDAWYWGGYTAVPRAKLRAVRITEHTPPGFAALCRAEGR